jgi:hypothetical protein
MKKIVVILVLLSLAVAQNKRPVEIVTSGNTEDDYFESLFLYSIREKVSSSTILRVFDKSKDSDHLIVRIASQEIRFNISQPQRIFSYSVIFCSKSKQCSDEYLSNFVGYCGVNGIDEHSKVILLKLEELPDN